MRWLIIGLLADLLEYAASWRCFLLHDCKPVTPPSSPWSRHGYWQCACGNRWVVPNPPRGGYAPGPDYGWVHTGEWRKMSSPPMNPPPRKPRPLRAVVRWDSDTSPPSQGPSR